MSRIRKVASVQREYDILTTSLLRTSASHVASCVHDYPSLSSLAMFSSLSLSPLLRILEVQVREMDELRPGQIARWPDGM